MNTLANHSFTLEALLSQGTWAQRLAQKLVSPGQDPEDLVQEGWMAGLRARPEINDGLRPWLARVLRNMAANLKRTHGRRQAREEVAGDQVLSMAVPSPEEVVGRMEIQRLLTDAVLALHPAMRDVVLLRFYQGLTSAEIARSQGIPEGTIRRRLKSALDELRNGLDKKFKGEQKDWMRGLGPLLTATGTGRPENVPVVTAGMHGARNMHLTLAAFVGVVLLAGVGYWAFVEKAGAPERTEQADKVGDRGYANSGGGATTRPIRPSSAPASAAWGILESCQKKLKVLRASIHATELEYIKKVSPDKLFASGNPNPTAEEVLAPVLARVMKIDGQWMRGLSDEEVLKFSQTPTKENYVPPDYTLECRTWACKMRVLNAQGQSADHWMLPLQGDPEMRDRTRGRMFKGGLLVTDPISGITFTERNVFLSLADPSGKRVPLLPAGPYSLTKPEWPSIPRPTIVPVPQTNAICQSEFVLAEKRLAMMKSEIERSVKPSELFERAVINTSLTMEFNRLVRATLELPIESTAVTVECRGFVCRAKFNSELLPDVVASMNQMKKIYNNNWKNRLEGGETHSLVQYYRIVPDGTAYGRDIVKDVYHNLLASTSLAACETKHSPKGTLDLDFEIPPTGEMNQDGELGKISAHLTGRFMDTAFGRCVEASLAQILERTPVPSKVSQGKLYGHIVFPRSKTHKP